MDIALTHFDVFVPLGLGRCLRPSPQLRTWNCHSVSISSALLSVSLLKLLVTRRMLVMKLKVNNLKLYSGFPLVVYFIPRTSNLKPYIYIDIDNMT